MEKELPQNFKECKSFDKDVVFLWKSDVHPIYISDNHLAAAWCWLQECEPNESYNFMHIDRHSDLKGWVGMAAYEFLLETFVSSKGIPYFCMHIVHSLLREPYYESTV